MKKEIVIVFMLYLGMSYVYTIHGTPLEKKCERLKLLNETIDFAEFIVD